MNPATASSAAGTMLKFAASGVISVPQNPASIPIAATAAGFLVESLVELSLWQVWRLSGLALAALLIALGAKAIEAGPRPERAP